MTSSNNLLFHIQLSAPTNIALIKYWGKKNGQFPLNPSVSMTLKNSVTKTSLQIYPRGEFFVEYLFEGKRSQDFERRVSKVLKKYCDKFNILSQYSFFFQSENSFPHSSGIASSASSFASIAYAINSFLWEKNEKVVSKNFNHQASYLARLGSGSASRSIHCPFNIWGEFGDLSCDEWATPLSEVHANFQNMRDAIVVVSREKKLISSSQGHALMNEHPYKEIRLKRSHQKCVNLLRVLKSGCWESFREIVEAEAFELHALMMSSSPPFLLMKPETLKIIEKVKEIQKTGLQICLTMDAGANLHLLYPAASNDEVCNWIQTEIEDLSEVKEVIFDKMGEGVNIL